jgi:hypothetical protein
MLSGLKKTHIVLLTDCLNNLEAGAEKQIFELAKRLPAEQFKICVVSLQADPQLLGCVGRGPGAERPGNDGLDDEPGERRREIPQPERLLEPGSHYRQRPLGEASVGLRGAAR